MMTATYILVTTILIAGLDHKTERLIIILFALWQMLTLFISESKELLPLNYYLISAIGNYLFVLLISQKQKLSDTVLAIQTIAYALIFTNLFGLISLAAYISQIYFESIRIFIFAFSVLISLAGERILSVYRILDRLRPNSLRLCRNADNKSFQQKGNEGET